FIFFFSSRRRHTRSYGDWSSDVCSSDLRSPLVIVVLENTAVTDGDLALFRDFPFVQTLSLSHTGIGDNGLMHLDGLPALEELIEIGRASCRERVYSWEQSVLLCNKD